MADLFDVPSCDKCRNPAIHHQVYSGRMMCGAHLADSVRKKVSKAIREQLKIPKGEHTIVFEFKPQVVQSGAQISLISSILFMISSLGAFIFVFRKKNK